MAEPRTSREALIAEILGDLDKLLARVERLPESIAEAEIRLTLTAQILEAAGDKYRLAITAFTEEAKDTLTEYVKHKASHAVTLASEEQDVRIRDAVIAALQVEAEHDMTRSASRAKLSALDRRASCITRLIEHGVTAVLASVLTVVLLLLIVDVRW